MRRLSFVLFLFFLMLPSYAASPVILKNPSALFFENSDVFTEKQVQKILIEALELSSRSSTVWSVNSKMPGLIVAEVVVRDKHVAYININYDSKKINIKYKNSYNLKFKKVGSRVSIIHPNYHIWIDQLVNTIKSLVAQNNDNRLLTSSDTPLKRIQGVEHIVVAVKAKIGSRDDHYKLSATASVFSKTLAELFTQSIRQEKKEQVTLEVIEVNDELRKLFKKKESNKKNKELCVTYNADKIFSVKTWRQRGGGGIRDVKYYLYDCLNNEKIKKKYEIEQADYDAYLYQAGFIDSAFDFIDFANI